MQPRLWILLGLSSGLHQTCAHQTSHGAVIDIQADDASRAHPRANHGLQKNGAAQAIGVRKMSDDESEMFFLDYWQFDPLAARAGSHPEVAITTNNTYEPLNPPLSPHSTSYYASAPLRLAHRIFKRDFQCPTNTFSCTSIGQPDSCCANGETCISVQDTGLGPVGCCPQGQSCGGPVASCNTAQGYSSCPGSPNGGCCIPGYSCQGVGCVLTGTSVLTPAPTTSSSVATPSVTATDTSISTVTTTVVISASASTQPTTVTQTLTITPSASDSGTPVPPFRPTSDSSTTSPTTTVPTSTVPTSVPNDQCPTNFYRCSAYYVGGCCRVGRDCSSTSCPPGSSTIVASDTHATVVAPTGGSCANGWQSCAPSVGGGCCPGGYVCGTATCSATAAGQSGVGKVSGGVVSRKESLVAVMSMASIVILSFLC